MDTTPDREEFNEAYGDEYSPATLSIDDYSVASEVVEDRWTGPRCEKCDAPFKSDVVSVCRSCGWYASLGTFVEVDPDWEVDDEQPAEKASASAAPSHVEVWLSLLPRWAWTIIASVLVVAFESIVARLITPTGSTLRTAWSLTQLFLGVMTFIGCHLVSFLVMAADDADFGVMDLILKPVKIWNRVVRSLPDRLWLVNSAACGLMAAVMSVLVIGGIPYERLWDWGFAPPPKQNLMGAVMSQMNKMGGQGADNLEDAVGDFAGKQNLDKANGKPTPTPKPRFKTDCVVLGYRADRQGQIHTLVLGTAQRGQLVYAGTVTLSDEDGDLVELLKMLPTARSSRPFLRLQSSATWVQPKFACRVSYTEQQPDGRLLGMKFDSALGEIKMP